MAVRRTRKDKEQSQLARALSASQRSETPSDLSYTYQTPASLQANKGLLRVDKSYILKDLLKTVVISVGLMVVLIGIYFYLRYN